MSGIMLPFTLSLLSLFITRCHQQMFLYHLYIIFLFPLCVIKYLLCFDIISYFKCFKQLYPPFIISFITTNNNFIDIDILLFLVNIFVTRRRERCTRKCKRSSTVFSIPHKIINLNDLVFT